MLVPPPNFGMVEENLYRSGQPDRLNLPFLEKLDLTSVIWLAPEEPDEALSVQIISLVLSLFYFLTDLISLFSHPAWTSAYLSP